MNKKLIAALVWLLATPVAWSQMVGPAITINGVEIPRRTVQAQTDHLVNQRGLGSGGITQPTAYQKIQEEVVEQIVVQELLWQEAQRREFVVSDEEVEATMAQIKSGFDSDMAFEFKIKEGGYTEKTFRENIRQQKSVQRMISEGIASDIEVSDAEVKAFYDENLEQMAIPERVHARHILVKFDKADPASRAAAEDKLAGIMEKLEAGESFAVLAIENSEGPTGAQGGDLGYFGRGQMVKEFDEAAFALAPGEVSGPVETQFGLHLIKVEAHDQAGTAALADVEPQIREYLAQQALYKSVEQLVEDLRADGDIQVNIF